MLQYLIDGYNLLFALQNIPRGTLEEKRAALIRLLQTQKPYGRNKAMVIFDSREGMGDHFQASELTVLFTSGETADDKISALVRQAPNPRVLIVVSNDRGIQTMIRGTGAVFMSTHDFLKGGSSKPPFPPAASMDPTQARDITDELKKEWLE